jgi:sortase A
VRATTAVGLRFAGWALIGAGLVVLLYLAHLLFFTNASASAAQVRLLQEWEAAVGAAVTGSEPDGPAAADEPVVGAASPSVPDEPSAVAVLEFVRPGQAERPVQADPLLVVSGVTQSDLARGPGYYPGSALPGQDGNFAIAGHRTTYGAPFFHLDQLQAGDEIHATDRGGRRYRYRVAEQRVVGPAEVGVLASDPLGTGLPTITLTTCHPRFSARDRLIVFGVLLPESNEDAEARP